MNLFEANALKSFHLDVIDGSTLFNQEDDADSLFLISSGYVVLCHGQFPKEAIVNYAGPGEVLGEQLLFGFSNSKRAYSAKAKGIVRCLRLNSHEISELKKTQKEVYIELLEICGKSCSQRLQRANQLIHCFKYEKKNDRLMHLILYLTETFGKKTTHGLEIYLPPDLFKFYIQMSPDDFNTCIKELTQTGVLKATSNHHYLLINSSLLIKKLPKIVDEIPSFPII